MEDQQIKLCFFSTATMLGYLLGDVIRIFARDFKFGKINDKPVKQDM